MAQRVDNRRKSEAMQEGMNKNIIMDLGKSNKLIDLNINRRSEGPQVALVGGVNYALIPSNPYEIAQQEAMNPNTTSFLRNHIK